MLMMLDTLAFSVSKDGVQCDGWWSCYVGWGAMMFSNELPSIGCLSQFDVAVCGTRWRKCSRSTVMLPS
jgi:hypothetical protein